MRRASKERDRGKVTKFFVWVNTEKRERGRDAHAELKVHQDRAWPEAPTRESAVGKYTEVFTAVVLDYALNAE